MAKIILLAAGKTLTGPHTTPRLTRSLPESAIFRYFTWDRRFPATLLFYRQSDRKISDDGRMMRTELNVHAQIFLPKFQMWRILSWLLLWSGSRIIVAHTHTHTESSLKCCGQSSHPPSLSGWKPAERHMRASPRPSAVNLQTSVVAAARNVTYRSHCVNTELNIDAGFLSFTVPLLSDPSHLSLTDGYLFCLPSKNISTII